MTATYSDQGRDRLLERITILENENAALVATLAERDAKLAEAYAGWNAANAFGWNILTDQFDGRAIALVAMRDGLKECARLRSILATAREVAERLTESADNAYRMLVEAEMREEAAKKRVALLTDALAAVEFGGEFDTCSICDGFRDRSDGRVHDPGCIVGIALGRIPAEVNR